MNICPIHNLQMLLIVPKRTECDYLDKQNLTLSWQQLPNGTQPTAPAHADTQNPPASLASITQKQSIPRFQSIRPNHLQLVNATNWSGPPAAPLIHSWRIWGLRGSHISLVWSMRKPPVYLFSLFKRTPNWVWQQIASKCRIVALKLKMIRIIDVSKQQHIVPTCFVAQT